MHFKINHLKNTFCTLLLFFGTLSAQEKHFTPFQDALKNPGEVRSVQFFKQSELNQLDKFPKLEEIKASWANLDSVPKKLFKISGLTHLDLYHNKLKSISRLLGSLQNLSYLNLSDNELTQLPSTCSNLKNLTYLNLLNNPLFKFPLMITGFQKLEHLTISGNFHGVPEELFSLTNLKELNAPIIFYNVPLLKLTQLKNLEILALHMNGLKTFPLQICELKNLKSLYLYGNSITQIPKGIGKLENLEFLMIEKIKVIPPEIKNCKNLKKVMIQMTQFSNGSLDNLFSVSSLEDVDLVACNISKLPGNASSLKNLKRLILTNNKISSLPADIKMLDSLSTLELNQNLFTKFPPDLCELQNLRHLNLNENTISEIPDCVLNLSRLSILSISSAKLFPVELLGKPMNFRFSDELSPEMKEAREKYYRDHNNLKQKEQKFLLLFLENEFENL